MILIWKGWTFKEQSEQKKFPLGNSIIKTILHSHHSTNDHWCQTAVTVSEKAYLYVHGGRVVWDPSAVTLCYWSRFVRNSSALDGFWRGPWVGLSFTWSLLNLLALSLPTSQLMGKKGWEGVLDSDRRSLIVILHPCGYSSFHIHRHRLSDCSAPLHKLNTLCLEGRCAKHISAC